MKTSNIVFVASFAAFLQAMPLFAKPWIASADGVEVNWANLTARFEGVAASDLANREGLKGLERTAWRNGYEKAGPAIDSILRSQHAALGMKAGAAEPSDEASIKAKEEVRKSVKSLNATFFASGAVEVSMEAALQAGFANALRKAGAGESRSAGEAEGATALLVKIPGGVATAVEPSVAFWLVDESGKVLFEPSQASGAVLSQGAMGRWYRGTVGAELSGMIAQNKDTLQVKAVQGKNRLVVSKDQFEGLSEASRSALINGKVALLAP